MKFHSQFLYIYEFQLQAIEVLVRFREIKKCLSELREILIFERNIKRNWKKDSDTIR